MTDGKKESNVQLLSDLSNGSLGPSFPRPSPRQRTVVFSNGLPIASGNPGKELRTDEAELASVMAKVTGRANPYANESNNGEAACQEKDAMNVLTSSLFLKSNINENSFESYAGIEFSKPAATTVNEVDTEILVSFSDVKDVGDPKSSSKSINRNVSGTILPEKYRKDENANDIFVEENQILFSHIYENPLGCTETDDRKICLEGKYAISKKVMQHEVQPRLDRTFEIKSAVMEISPCVMPSGQESKNTELKSYENPLVCTKTSERKSCLEVKDAISKKVISLDESQHEVQPRLDRTFKIKPVVMEISPCVMTSGQESKNTEALNGNTAPTDDEISKKLDQGKTSCDSEDKKIETIKACFPSVKPKVPSKTFVADSPEIQQNIINRRAAARNATSIAEFEPLVTVSPEAEKLAMWKRPDSTEKQSLTSPDLKPASWTIQSAPVDSPTGVEASPGAKDTACCIPKDLRKLLLSPKSTEKKNPKEEDVNGGGNKRRDSERGNNGNDEVLKTKGEAPRRPWLVPLLLLVLVPIAITVVVLLVKLKPWISSDPNTESSGIVENLKGEVHDHYPKTLEEIIKKLEKIKDLKGDSKDINITTEVDNIYDSGFSTTEKGKNQDDLVTESSVEENDIHSESEDARNETSSQINIDKQHLISLMTNKDPQITESPPEVPKGICSSLVDLDSIEMCAKIKPSVLKLVLKYIKLSQKSGDIIISDYIKMYRYINSFLSSFGGFAVIQTKMLEERIKQLEDLTTGVNAVEYTNLSQMIQFEISSGIVSNTDTISGSVIFTCLHRHLQFLTMGLEKTLQLNAGDSLESAFDPAYQEILSKHHSWYVKIIYEVGLRSMITMEQATAILSIRQVEDFTIEELLESLKTVIKQLESLNQFTEGILTQTNVLKVLPKEVIT